MEAAGSFLLFTEHMPSEFAAEGGLVDASGATFGPNDTKLITEKLLPASSAAEQKEAQDLLLGEIGIALGGLGVLLGAVAVAVACTAAAASRKGTPTMSAIQMSGGARNGGDPMPTDACELVALM